MFPIEMIDDIGISSNSSKLTLLANATCLGSGAKTSNANKKVHKNTVSLAVTQRPINS